MDDKLIKLVADFKRPSPRPYRAPPPPPKPPKRRAGGGVGRVVLGVCVLILGVGALGWDLLTPEPEETPFPIATDLPPAQVPEEPKVAEAPAPEKSDPPPPSPSLDVEQKPAPSEAAPAPKVVAEPKEPPPAVEPEPPKAQPEPAPVAPKPVPKPVIATGKDAPVWLRNAAAMPTGSDGPMIAIVIDDLGVDKKRTERVIALKQPLTLSFLPYATELPRQTEAARKAGHELMVHVPMEPLGAKNDPGPGGLKASGGAQATLKQLRWDLSRFDAYVGINNHMGSKFTADKTAMTPVIEELKARGLLFLDSRTIGDTTGASLAQALGVPNASRDVFLDNEPNSAAIGARLGDLEAVARRTGMAIAIGHPHDATIDALTIWLQTLPAKGLVQVPLTAIVKHRLEQGETPPNGG